MKFEKARTAQKGDLMQALFEDLAAQGESLPMERYCTRGGWPLNSKISTLAILENSPAMIKAVVYVSFTESGAACCSGDNFEHERFEELHLEIDKSDWSYSFPASD